MQVEDLNESSIDIENVPISTEDQELIATDASRVETLSKLEDVEVPDSFDPIWNYEYPVEERNEKTSESMDHSSIGSVDGLAKQPKLASAASEKASHPQAAEQPLPSGDSAPRTRRKTDTALARTLQFSSSACAVAGGVLVSSNTAVSKYGFIILALSSSQIFASSFLLRNQSLMIYAASLFIFVDCLGIYRWLLQ